jgi:hypothetical protein
MSATIRIESGIAAGTSYWIDRPVLRIGSDPQCEICLPSAELAPHALTLEFRGGAYRAYNRGTAAISIGRTVVQPGAAGAWDEGAMAHLPDDLRLVLEVDGDPRPSPRQETRFEDGFASDAAADSAEARQAVGAPTTKKSSKTALQLGIIGLCVLAGVGFLFMPRGEDAPVVNRPTFETLVNSGLKKDENVRALTQQLQYAQAALVRGHNELAGILFLRLRDRLVRQQNSLPEADREHARKMLDYVQFRLSQFQQ